MLKYLFKAIYSDGSEYNQTSEDVSAANPNKSAFFDVDQEKLVRFELIGDGKIISVDLISGEFTLNGFPVSILLFNKDDNDFQFTPIAGGKLRLIYFRRRTVLTNSPYSDTSYLIGWQTTIDGQNHKRILEFR